VALYEAVRPEGSDVDGMREALERSTVDALTFTSGSTVRHFAELLGPDAGALVAASGALVACIGPVTAETARQVGMSGVVQPALFTIAALVDLLMAHFCTTGGDPISETPGSS
jgi:uroporphyrinogen III methyltransferase/synthase